MKTMTYKQLAGACDKEFHAETFEEMGEMSKKHVMLYLRINNILFVPPLQQVCQVQTSIWVTKF